MAGERILGLVFADVYPMYIAKVERKGRTQEEVDQVIYWLTGYDEAGLKQQMDAKATFKEFFEEAPLINAQAEMVTGVICGIRVENIEDPIIQNSRRLDKLVDEIANGRPMEKILRS